MTGVDLWDDLRKTAGGAPASPLEVEGAFRNCFKGGNPAGVAAGTSDALLDRMLENDMGFDTLWSSCIRELLS